MIVHESYDGGLIIRIAARHRMAIPYWRGFLGRSYANFGGISGGE
jgi:hypothetical protein